MTFFHQLRSGFKKIDKFLDQEILLILLLALVIVLRIPNFFEPYWYGDEGIYLAVGEALNKGAILYKDIIDHKTPLIYFLARVPNQVSFRVLNLLWMLFTTGFFYLFAKRLFKKKKPAFIASLIMVLFTTLPLLEGNIPNGELFVMGFVMLAAYLLSFTPFFKLFFQEKREELSELNKISKKEFLLLSTAGIFFSLGILTKIPAILDFGAFLALFPLFFVSEFFNEHRSDIEIKKLFSALFWRILILGVACLLPIILSIVYFATMGALQDYLDFGLLYNIRYSQEWSQDFGSPFLNFSFSLLGKTLYLFLFYLLMLFNSRQMRKRSQFLNIWFLLGLYSVLLSSRPYPHYFQQMIPAFSLLLVDVGLSLQKIWKKIRRKERKHLLIELKGNIFAVISIGLVFYVLLTFRFHPYPTLSYYQNFWKLMTGQMTKEAYDNSFDPLVAENKVVSSLIQDMGIEKIFIWGTNPMLYPQSHSVPTSRFTVSFHIKDFQDHDRTFEQIQAEKPKLIIVMNNEHGDFPKLTDYLRRNYIPNRELEMMTLYLRNDALNTP